MRVPARQVGCTLEYRYRIMTDMILLHFAPQKLFRNDALIDAFL